MTAPCKSGAARLSKHLQKSRRVPVSMTGKKTKSVIYGDMRLENDSSHAGKR